MRSNPAQVSTSAGSLRQVPASSEAPAGNDSQGVVTPAEGPGSLFHRARVGAEVALGTACGAWAGDVVLSTYSRGRATWAQWLNAIGAALWVSVTSAVVVGAILGLLLAPSVTQAVDTLRTKWRALREGSPQARRGLVAGALVLVAFSWALGRLAYRANMTIELAFSRPDTIAVALTAFQCLLLALVILAWKPVNRAARQVVDAASQWGAARWVLSRAASAAALALVVVGSVAAIGVVEFVRAWSPELAAMPWRNVVPATGALVGVLLVGVLLHTVAMWPQRAALGAVAIATAAGGVAAFRLKPESSAISSMAFGRMLSGRLGYAAWVAALDVDRDGQIGILGGGDCAPLDSKRFTGAIEIPGNDIDEDCDGTDLPKDAALPKPRPPVGAAPVGSRPLAYDGLPQRPDIVLVTIDALGAPRLAALGRSPPLMPHLDDFATRSALFTRCFTQGPSTRLSFPSMFTSRYDSELPFEPGARLPYSFSPTERQLQDILDDAGYQTAAVVPNEYFGRARWPSITRGFQRVDESALASGLKHDAPQVTKAALAILGEDRHQPLFMWVHYYDAHPPYLDIPDVSYPDHNEETLYDAELRLIDHELGRLLGTLEQRPNPVYIFVTSDHATVFHPDPTSRIAHYGFDLYSATLHVPLMVRGPGVRPHKIETLVSTIDVAPTVADLLRWTDSAELEGTSLVPELLGQAGDPQPRTLFHELYLPERLFHGYQPLEIVSLHQGPYNLILSRVRGTYEFYDWTEDYFEQSDLYQERAGSPDVKRLKSLLGLFVTQVAAHDRAAIVGPNSRLLLEER